MCPKSQDFEAKGESCCVWRWGGAAIGGFRGGPLYKDHYVRKKLQLLSIQKNHLYFFNDHVITLRAIFDLVAIAYGVYDE
jgi:hypothetical protein